jgi:pyridinium-3,5-biscarboxylic acid mononucleotide sulfurtransferase
VSTLDDRLEALAAQFAPLPGVLVAFSGGVDSGVVLAAAVRALGADRVVAATAVSPSLPAAERAGAAAFAATLGVRHEQPRTDELSREGYRANAGDRCAFCKAELVDVLTPLAARLGIADVVTGTNADDLKAGFRPGIRAATERGAWAPLARAGMSKDDVRAAARLWDLPLADKPAAACLASRIAYGVPVSAEGLARVEAAEADLRAGLAAAGLSARDLRVRDLGGDVARVEVDRPLVGELAARPELLAAVSGFQRVEVDPRGFRSGSMNELLPDPVRYR